MDISVVTTVLNEAHSIEKLIAALAAQTLPPAEVLVVDGGSIDGTHACIKRALAKYPSMRVRLLRKTGNRSVGRNAGIARAQHNWIAITDAGCVPHPGWLRELAAASRRSRASVISGFTIADSRTPLEEAVTAYTLVMPDQVNEATYLPATRSLLLARSTWQQLGGFDESLADNEDYEFARRLEKGNVSRAFAREAIVSWRPRSTLRSFGWMIFRFARGDARAGLWRPKVGLIFARYLLAGLLIIATWPNLLLSALAFVVYCSWAILKNARYTPRGWLWLPVLQLVSDVMVMTGTIAGSVVRLLNFGTIRATVRPVLRQKRTH